MEVGFIKGALILHKDEKMFKNYFIRHNYLSKDKLKFTTK